MPKTNAETIIPIITDILFELTTLLTADTIREEMKSLYITSSCNPALNEMRIGSLKFEKLSHEAIAVAFTL